MRLISLSQPARRGLLLVLFGLAFAVVHAAPARWVKVEADSFTVLSDAPEPAVRDAAVRYAAFRRVFGELFLGPGASLPPSTLLLFRTEGDFRAHVPEPKQRRSKLVNYNADLDGAPLLTFALAGDRDRALAMTFEFETIWSLNRVGYAVPVWMSQGAGQVLSGLTLQKGRCIVDNTERSFRDAYRWPQFLEIGETSKAYTDPHELPAFLAQATGLMHWVLLQDDQPRARVTAIAGRLRTESATTALAAVMGLPPEEWTRAIRQHLARSNGRAFPFDEPAERAAMRVLPAPEPEVLATRANLLAAWGETGRADALLDRALALDPTLPAVKEAQARRLLRRDQPDEAVALYREAIAAGTKNFTAYLHSAAARMNDSMVGGTDVGGEGGPQSALAVEEIRQAIKLNPGSDEAYRLLGRAFWLLPKIGDAELAELSRGPLDGERGHPVRYYRSLLYSRLGRTAEADADLRAIIADPQADTRNRQLASQRLLSERVRRQGAEVTELLNQRKFGEARAAARAPSDAEESVREACQRMERIVDEQEAWNRLVNLQEAAKWQELSGAAGKFAADFPESRMAGEARRLVKTAAEIAISIDAQATGPVLPANPPSTR